MASFEPQNRNYSEWTFKGDYVDSKAFDPVRNKMLVGDTIKMDSIERTSKYRVTKSIPGVLVYNGKTYGRHSGKMLYKCVPNDRRLPVFLIPYASKKTTFNKSKTNKFVLFQFVEWTGKHPLGMITNNLGEVNDISVFYSYQLFCKDIHIPIQRFTKAAKLAVNRKQTIPEWMNNMEDRTSLECITIDPGGSVDFDDALGIVEKADGGHIISVYISNVVAWLDSLCLWEHLTDRVATIYLPDSKRPLLPTILSDDLCSLVEGKQRYAVVMDVSLTPDNSIESVDFTNCVIKVAKNYVYEEKDLLENPQYKVICSIARVLSLETRYVETIEDSHDVVAFYMIMMNHRVGTLLLNTGRGIFRGVSTINKEERVGVPQEIKRVVTLWRNTKGDYETSEKHKGHDLIGSGLDAYAQVTSPIRRVVDLVNIIELQFIKGFIQCNSQPTDFVSNWMKRVDYINKTMKNISKVQNDCMLLERCINMSHSNEAYTGYVIEVKDNECKSLLIKWTYYVYIPSIKITARFHSQNKMMLYEKHKFSLHIFIDESTLKQKVRVNCLSFQ